MPGRLLLVEPLDGLQSMIAVGSDGHELTIQTPKMALHVSLAECEDRGLLPPHGNNKPHGPPLPDTRIDSPLSLSVMTCSAAARCATPNTSRTPIALTTRDAW